MKSVKQFFGSMGRRTRGLWITLIFSLGVLYFFFGDILRHPNRYYFDKTGDGLLTYYYATYQLKYDSTYGHLGASFYPYGESVFFSSDQTVITAALRFINNNLFKVEDDIPGIFNMLMLLSFPLCAIFLFLILYDLKINYLFAAAYAVGMTFLSPQWIRIQSHFPLSYAFAIPALFYLLMRFHKEPTYKRSFLIALLVFIMLCLHAYFLGMFGIVLLLYHILVPLGAEKKIKAFVRSGFHFAIQLVLPFLIFQFMVGASSNVTDRPSYPWGFLLYVSSFDGMFFPYGLPYQDVFKKINTPEEITQYEGLSYVGLFAMIIGLIFVLKRLSKLVEYRFRDLFSLPADKTLIIFLIAGALGALYACGIPYIYDENLVHYVGPLRQMRGLGRFAWLLFYSLNIFAAWYYLGAISRVGKKWLRIVLTILPLIILYYDAYYHVLPVSEAVANEIPQIADRGNKTRDNIWLDSLDTKRYQAIIPIPYFLQGSENIGYEPSNKVIVTQAYIASMKTGLPLTAGILSRTSLHQTFENIPLILEPYRPLEFVKHLPNKKPFLVLARRNEIDVPSQHQLLAKTKFVKYAAHFEVLELPYEALATYADSLYQKTTEEMNRRTLYDVDGWKSTQDKKNFVYRNFDDINPVMGYRGTGALVGKIKDYNTLFADTIPNGIDGQKYLLSFWMRDFQKDLYPRTTIEIAYVDGASGQVYNSFWTNGSKVKTLDGSWALIELEIQPAHAHDKVLVTLFHQFIIDNSKLVVDELMIRPEGVDLYKPVPDGIIKNDRYYLKPGEK